MERVLITGITGKSGEYLCDEILSNINKLQDYYFGFVVRNKEKARLISKKINHCSIYIGDLDDDVFLKRVFSDGYTLLLHIAGIQKSLNTVKAAINSGVKWMILVHTTGIFSKYKAAGEGYRTIESKIKKLLLGKEIALTILRPTMIYGNIHDGNVAVFMKMVYKLRLFPVVNHANYELQPVWCGDLGKAYYQVLTHPNSTQNKEYNLSGGSPLLLIDMFKIMASKLGVTNRFVNVPFWLAYSLAWLLYFITIGKIDFREKVQRLVEPRVFSYEAASRDFGYAPLTFEDGIDGEIEEFKRTLKNKQ